MDGIQLLIFMPHYYTNAATCEGSQDPRVKVAESLGLTHIDVSLVAGDGLSRDLHFETASVASTFSAQLFLFPSISAFLLLAWLLFYF